jgi:hypothetical protein
VAGSLGFGPIGSCELLVPLEVMSRSSSSRVLAANRPGAAADRLRTRPKFVYRFRTAGDVEPSRLAANLFTNGDLDAASHQAAVIR